MESANQIKIAAVDTKCEQIIQMVRPMRRVGIGAGMSKVFSSKNNTPMVHGGISVGNAPFFLYNQPE